MRDPIAYCYEASCHCPEHTSQRFGSAEEIERTEKEDREGNPVTPIFDHQASELGNYLHCDECLYEAVSSKQQVTEPTAWTPASTRN